MKITATIFLILLFGLSLSACDNADEVEVKAPESILHTPADSDKEAKPKKGEKKVRIKDVKVQGN